MAADHLIEAGIQAEARGELRESEQFFRAAVESDPKSARAHINLGLALHGQKNHDAAVREYEEALRLDPTLAAAHFNLALTHLALGETERAEGGFRTAARLNPEFPEAWVGLAEALELRGKEEEAVAVLMTAISLRKEYVGALFNAAVLLRKLGRLDEAEALLKSIPRQHPEFANAMTALAAILRDQGRVDDAVLALRSAVERAPDSRSTQSELLFTLGFSDKVTAEGLFAEHVAAGIRIAEATPPGQAAFPNPPDPERVLNVGYLSGDFRMHSVAAFTEFLFSLHKRSKVRVYAYSSTPVHDAMTRKIMGAVDGWRELRDQPDAAVVSAILEDEIDLLVDLSGHTSGARAAVLASRAAPVQVTWLGYMNTTGLRTVDYRITDAIADPPGTSEALYTEALLRMPNSQWCYRPPEAATNLVPERALRSAPFTFGALNQFAKVSDATIALWVAVLLACPASRLRVVNVPKGSATDRLTGLLTGAGIDRSRFDLVERVPHLEYYRQYALVDACLDSTPYSGGTTTCDSLFLGVPVVTLAGPRPISRSSASLLSTVGMPHLVATSKEEFVSIAAGLAAKGSWPTFERITLARQMRASPLMNERAFTADLEQLYRNAWRRWCERRAV